MFRLLTIDKVAKSDSVVRIRFISSPLNLQLRHIVSIYEDLTPVTVAFLHYRHRSTIGDSKRMLGGKVCVLICLNNNPLHVECNLTSLGCKIVE